MKHILLLSDFSNNSKNAIDYALQFFRKEKCVFYVLFVKSSGSYTTDDLMTSATKSIYDAILKSEKNKLAKLVSALKVDYPNENHTFRTIVDYDNFIDSIKQVVESKKINLIVMGTNGVTGAKEVVFGSNTINVVRSVNCDTLVIPEGFKYNHPHKLLLPLDAFDSLQGKTFTELAKFIKKHKFSLYVLRINPSDEGSNVEISDTDEISYNLKSKNFSYHIITNIPMHYVVDCFLQIKPMDMIALIVQKETLFERFFIGSPTTQIGNNLKVPLLIAHS